MSFRLQYGPRQLFAFIGHLLVFAYLLVGGMTPSPVDHSPKALSVVRAYFVSYGVFLRARDHLGFFRVAERGFQFLQQASAANGDRRLPHVYRDFLAHILLVPSLTGTVESSR